jgi:AraC-like DNA-binding protein
MRSDINQLLGAGSAMLLLLLAALLFRDYRAVAAGRLAAAFALGSAAHAVTATTGFAAPVTPWHAALIAISTGNVVVFWLFARALFDDTFVTRRWFALPWAGMVGLSLINCLVLVPAGVIEPRIFAVVINLLSLGFVALAVGQTVASWSADLVEQRRRLRVFVVVLTALYAGSDIVAQLLVPAGSTAFVATANAVILAAVVIAIACSLLRVSGETIFPAVTAQVAAAAVPAASIGDRRLLDALMRLMADERIYRHEGITIGTLAGKLAVPEYKLRRLINGELGYRNFNAFLNDHRIAEAKAALADPSQAEVPVITIAMDAGFQSLGPFNRAFKATTGLTPTEYRRRNEARAS